MKKFRFRKRFIVYKDLKNSFVKLISITLMVFVFLFGRGIMSTIAEVMDIKYMRLFIASVIPAEVLKEDRASIQQILLGFDPQNPVSILENGLYTASADNHTSIPSPTATSSPTTAPQPVTESSVTTNTGDVTDDGVAVRNHTTYTPDLNGLINEKLKFTVSDKEPSVLIVHTHASEAYTPTAQNNYTPTDPDRTEDINYNVVRVGKELADTLRQNSINVIHDTTIHDYPSYNGSYSNCRKTVENYIAKYPSIKIILDVHRDAIVKSDGTKVKLTSDTNEGKAAQVMIVTGTDACGLPHPNWQENLKFAMKLQRRVNLYYPTLMRPIDLREERFNTNTSLASVILEMGTNGNTLEEAVLSARCIGFALADMMQFMK